MLTVVVKLMATWPNSAEAALVKYQFTVFQHVDSGYCAFSVVRHFQAVLFANERVMKRVDLAGLTGFF